MRLRELGELIENVLTGELVDVKQEEIMEGPMGDLKIKAEGVGFVCVEAPLSVDIVPDFALTPALR